LSERSTRVLLAVLAVAGLLTSAYLTYLELIVIYAICQWYVTSAVQMTAPLSSPSSGSGP
jgi:uncharacterized membrane protein